MKSWVVASIVQPHERMK